MQGPLLGLTKLTIGGAADAHSCLTSVGLCIMFMSSWLSHGINCCFIGVDTWHSVRTSYILSEATAKSDGTLLIGLILLGPKCFYIPLKRSVLTAFSNGECQLLDIILSHPFCRLAVCVPNSFLSLVLGPLYLELSIRSTVLLLGETMYHVIHTRSNEVIYLTIRSLLLMWLT